MNKNEIERKTNLYLAGDYELQNDEYMDPVLYEVRKKEFATPCRNEHYLNDEVILQLYHKGVRQCPLCRADTSREWARIANIQQRRQEIQRENIGSQNQALVRQRVVDWLRYNRITTQPPSRGSGLAAAAQFRSIADQRTAFRQAAFPTTFRTTPANLRARFYGSLAQRSETRAPPPTDYIELSDSD